VTQNSHYYDNINQLLETFYVTFTVFVNAVGYHLNKTACNYTSDIMDINHAKKTSIHKLILHVYVAMYNDTQLLITLLH